MELFDLTLDLDYHIVNNLESSYLQLPYRAGQDRVCTQLFSESLKLGDKMFVIFVLCVSIHCRSDWFNCLLFTLAVPTPKPYYFCT